MFHFRLIPFFGAVAALLLTGCYDSRFGEPDDDGEGKPATETIAALRDRYAGTPFTVTGDIVVTGRVASCDRAENFYRTLCICDAEAGLEVMAGIDHLHNDFPIGSRVTLSLRGLAVAESRGVLQAGRPPAAGSGYATNYIGSRAALGAVLVRSGEALAAPSPAPLAIPALTESRCGTLVRIDGVRYTPEDLSAATWVGYKRFTDADGNAVYTYVRRYARFADAEVPAGTVSLTGILQYDAAGDGRYILKLRDENDSTQYPADAAGRMRPGHAARIHGPSSGAAEFGRLPQIALRREEQRRDSAGHHHPRIRHGQ